MIQRIQTLYLILAMALQVLVPFVPGGRELFVQGGISLILILGAGVLSFITILLYKNRPVQLTVSKVNIVVTSLALIILVVQKLILPGGEVPVKGIEYFGMALVLAAAVLVLLAQVAIRRDEMLVKSADRLR